MILLTAALLSAMHYCSPTACAGQGTEALPWSLAQCLDPANGAVAGDTITMQPGVYDCSAQCDFRHDDVVYLGHGALLQDTRSGEGTGRHQTVSVWCRDCGLNGFEVTNTSWSPTTETPMAVEVHGRDVWLSGWRIHRAHGGVFTGGLSRAFITETEISDIGANGHGHGLYLQGATTVEATHIRRASGYGVQVWSSQDVDSITLRQVSTRASGRGGFVIGGAGTHTNIRVQRSAFLSRPSYSHESVHVLSHRVTMVIEDSLLQGGLVFGSPGDEGAALTLTGNVMYGGPLWPGLQIPVWVFGAWTPADACDPTHYCGWVCGQPSNRWIQRAGSCSCDC